MSALEKSSASRCVYTTAAFAQSIGSVCLNFCQWLTVHPAVPPAECHKI